VTDAAVAGESAAAQKILAWGFFVALVALAAVGRGLLWAVAGGSSAFDFAVALGGVWLSWLWLDAQLRPHRTTYPLDVGLLMFLVFTPTALYLLWTYERWRGAGKVVLLTALWISIWPASIVVWWVFRALLARGPT
jgi:hypothetical protein